MLLCKRIQSCKHLQTSLYSKKYQLNEIKSIASDFWEVFRPFRVFAFYGEMGAGKTTFIHTLCDYLNVKDAVSSPTFALINEYHFDENGVDKTIYHMDWYRINSDEEAIQAGMEDAVMNKNAIVFVEWAEKAENILPKPYMKIHIQNNEDGCRQIDSYIIE